jgi:UDP-glucose 4-epimerase
MYDFFHKMKRDPSKLEILGDGKQSKSYLYIDDCLDAIIMIGEWIRNQPLGTYDFFNLGTKDWQSVTHLAEVMVGVMGLENVKFEYTGGKRGWKGDVVKNLLDISKIQKLGWNPKTSFKQGIKNYVASLEN